MTDSTSAALIDFPSTALGLQQLRRGVKLWKSSRSNWQELQIPGTRQSVGSPEGADLNVTPPLRCRRITMIPSFKTNASVWTEGEKVTKQVKKKTLSGEK